MRNRQVVYTNLSGLAFVHSEHTAYVSHIQGVPLATEPDISLIILPLMRILQRNLRRTYLIVQEM